ncbi:response regulator [Flavisolibacter nicotianae]|uniref:response regulator n=1 Tax=Flavisolibacter nicotianae TaxID=2364882 RepID=UPI000EAD9CA7|nr:response regulator [Flavisolibacter nicotianae]
MGNKRILYFLLGAYLVGNLLLIFIQYNWAKNINTLIGGNEKLVSEFTVSGELTELERDILAVESRIRGTVNTRDTAFINGLEAQIVAVEAGIDRLKNTSDNDSSIQYIAILDRLVHDKLVHSRNILNTYYGSGKTAAESVIATRKGKELTDSIMIMARTIELARQRHLSAVTSTIDTSGANALHLGIILITTVLTCGAFVFWYIINTIRRQNGLIYQLNVSEKKVREVARVKENFLANMSHEIRTPMNAILGYTNLLRRKPELDTESQQYVQTIQRSGENLLTIINEILDLSKIEAGMMRIESAPFSLRGLLHSVEAMFRPKAVAKGLDLQTEVAIDVPDSLEGDAVRLTQVLVNLVGNAVKFTGEGQIRMAVRKESESGDTVMVDIAVADTGIGIEKEKLATVFERFQQAEDSVTRKYGGTGLGLAIAKDLVELQGGTISVESEAGKGTTFRVRLPYKRSLHLQPMPATVERMSLAAPRFPHTAVLVVEDNEINRGLLRTLLRQWQVQCDFAGNGKEAIQKLERQKFDLVLMDIQMPEMDGYTATQAIRTELGLQIPIIAMTAHAMAGEREKCLGYGMNDYLSKPVREEQLQKILLRFAAQNNPVHQTSPDVKNSAVDFRYIDLSYMKEVSGGNAAYEKLVTEQFLELLPADLATIEKAWHEKEISLLRRTAHNMKTTISVMGLNDRLQTDLDGLELEDLTEESFWRHFTAVKTVCEASLQEAEAFHSLLA